MATSAIRLDGMTAFLATSNGAGEPVDYESPYTFCGMFRLPNAVSAFKGLLSIMGTDATDMDAVEFGNDGKIYPDTRAAGTYGTNTLGTQAAPGTWMHVAYIRTATQYEYYENGVLKATSAFSAGTRGTAAQKLFLGAWGGSEPMPGDYAFWRLAPFAMTVDQLADEATSATPVTPGITHDWPLQSTTDLADSIGSHDFTAAGTVTTTDGPPGVGGASTIDASASGSATLSGSAHADLMQSAVEGSASGAAVLSGAAHADLRQQTIDASGAGAAVLSGAASAQLAGEPPPGFYASPTGTSDGVGTFDDPWDLQTALSGGPTGTEIGPGGRIIVRGGTYTGPFACALTGAAGSGIDSIDGKIIVRAFPGERPRLRQSGGTGAAVVTGTAAYTWFVGLDVAAADTTGQDTMGFDVGVSTSPGVKFIHCLSHDNTGNGIGMFSLLTDAEAYANYIWGNGITGSQPGVSYGHGIYSQNVAPSTRRQRENLIFSNFGYGLHNHSGGQDNLIHDGNVAFNNALKVGTELLIGNAPGDQITVTHQTLFRTSAARASQEAVAQIGSLSEETGLLSHLTATDNNFGGLVEFRFINPGFTNRRNTFSQSQHQVATLTFPSSALAPVGYDWDDNSYYYAPGNDGIWISVPTTGAAWQGNYATLGAWQATTGIDGSSTLVLGGSPGDSLAVRAVDAYDAVYGSDEERPIAHIFAETPSGAATVAVDLSGILAPGDTYAIYHIYDWCRDPRGAPLVSGTYAGEQPSLAVAAPAHPTLLGATLRSVTPWSLGDEAGCYVVTRTSIVAGTGTASASGASALSGTAHATLVQPGVAATAEGSAALAGSAHANLAQSAVKASAEGSAVLEGDADAALVTSPVEATAEGTSALTGEATAIVRGTVLPLHSLQFGALIPVPPALTFGPLTPA